jgi:predicted unusual protein kinase regulating ubiquinone biosynthesis (AarF/ABC1/UbiB family)
MKAGQIMSMIDARALGTGGFSPYQKAMNRLQADAPPMHPALVREVLDAELGSAVEQFAEFTDEPIAAASIGQVHRGILRDGRQVASRFSIPVWPKPSATIWPTPSCWRRFCDSRPRRQE